MLFLSVLILNVLSIELWMIGDSSLMSTMTTIKHGLSLLVHNTRFFVMASKNVGCARLTGFEQYIVRI